MFSFKTGGLVAAFIFLAQGVASAEDFKAGDLIVRHPWARATPKGAKVAGGYLTIVNNGPVAETLTGGSLVIAGRFAVHDMTMDGGVMRMREAGPLEIPPGGSVTFAPSARHIMFMDLQRGLQKGETIEGALTFSHAGTVPVRFTVEDLGAKAPIDETHHAMPGMDMN